ncbi:MAG: hypothetical protein ABS46_17045 [Cytophagaceae bacterium SCN 52-12]|nr:MAG: hypothetical protein ABS46_17045 [Cytophagaceae bacterium SCN 52-12]
MGPLATADYESRYRNSQLYRKYKDSVDPESAYEVLARRIEEQNRIAEQEKQIKEEAKQKTGSGTRRAEKSAFEQVLSAPITRQIGRELIRGVFGMLTGKKTTSKSKGWF